MRNDYSDKQAYDDLFWEPTSMEEPELPEGAATLALLQNDQTGVLDLVLLGQGDGQIQATLSEGPGGWHVTQNGVYLTAGPKRTLEAALLAVLSDRSVMNRLIMELVSDTEDTATCPIPDTEVRNG